MINFFSLYTKIENPTLEMVIFTFLLSFCLSSLIAFTYKRTSIKTTNNRNNFLQSLILGALIATMVLQVIGDNVASGLAMLGALNIVQFRTKLRTPRESIFMFAALGIGIACGLFGFFVAILGAFCFCLVAFTMRFTSLHEQPKKEKKTMWVLKLCCEEKVRLHEDFEFIVKEYCTDLRQKGIVYVPNSLDRNYTFSLAFKDIEKQQDFLNAFSYINVKIMALEIR
ncbi:MAG: DUF4956 domain-containing protein [Saprospiraceae bacterium]|nr:DUF4956 domain-containing protein [Saprospiraceae bacterium]